jgi:hypothetical protein
MYCHHFDHGYWYRHPVASTKICLVFEFASKFTRIMDQNRRLFLRVPNTAVTYVNEFLDAPGFTDISMIDVLRAFFGITYEHPLSAPRKYRITAANVMDWDPDDYR